MTHDSPHPDAGRTVAVFIPPECPLTTPSGTLHGLLKMQVRDWSDRVLGYDLLSRHPDRWVTFDYINRSLRVSLVLPKEFHHEPDTETVYGYINGLAHIVHQNELIKKEQS